MISEIKHRINESYYWDARVKEIDCSYFGDEVKIIFGNTNKDICYPFEGCYEVEL